MAEMTEIPDFGPEANRRSGAGQTMTGQVYKGAFLMYGGLLVPRMEGDYMSIMIHLARV